MQLHVILYDVSGHRYSTTESLAYFQIVHPWLDNFLDYNCSTGIERTIILKIQVDLICPSSQTRKL